MPNIPDPPTTVNTSHPTPIAAVNEAESLRTQALESWALVEALVDVLETLPPDLAHERIQQRRLARVGPPENANKSGSKWHKKLLAASF